MPRNIEIKAGIESIEALLPRARALAQQYARIVAEEEFAAWLSSLKESNPVKINKAALENKDR